jgi:hypothetical protein
MPYINRNLYANESLENRKIATSKYFWNLYNKLFNDNKNYGSDNAINVDFVLTQSRKINLQLQSYNMQGDFTKSPSDESYLSDKLVNVRYVMKVLNCLNSCSRSCTSCIGMCSSCTGCSNGCTGCSSGCQEGCSSCSGCSGGCEGGPCSCSCAPTNCVSACYGETCWACSKCSCSNCNSSISSCASSCSCSGGSGGGSCGSTCIPLEQYVLADFGKAIKLKDIKIGTEIISWSYQDGFFKDKVFKIIDEGIRPLYYYNFDKFKIKSTGDEVFAKKNVGLAVYDLTEDPVVVETFGCDQLKENDEVRDMKYNFIKINKIYFYTKKQAFEVLTEKGNVVILCNRNGTEGVVTMHLSKDNLDIAPLEVQQKWQYTSDKKTDENKFMDHITKAINAIMKE